ncbi:MAG: hypothetical protein U0R50_08070 [Gaiellales bacterium]
MSTEAHEPEQLADAVRSLQGTVDALRADVKRIGASEALPADSVATDAADHGWVTTLTAPAPRHPAVPRFLLETVFLASCAVAAAIARLDALVIAGVMAGAWVLVALIEWAASRADRYEEELLYAPPPVPAPHAPAVATPDPAWFSPPVEQTILAADADGATAIARLPPRLEDPQETMEHRVDDVFDDTGISLGEETGALGVAADHRSLDDTQH